MREPRGHAAMSGAILQPPCRDDADWGVLYIEVTGCLPMCGHGTIGVATVLVETGMVEVHEPETRRAPRHAGRPGRGARAGARTAARSRVTLRNVPAFLHAHGRRGRAACRYDMAFGGNFYAIADAAAAGLEVAARAGRGADRGRTRADGRDRRSPCTPRTRTSAAVATSSSPRPARTAPTPFGHRDPSRLARPLAVRHRHERAHGPALRARRARRSARRS